MQNKRQSILKKLIFEKKKMIKDLLCGFIELTWNNITKNIYFTKKKTWHFIISIAFLLFPTVSFYLLDKLQTNAFSK